MSENKTVYKKPIKQYMKDLIEENEEFYPRTFDVSLLQSHIIHFIFVYGTLKKGFPNQEIMKDFTYLGKGITSSKNMLMFETQDFPMIVNDLSLPVDAREIYSPRCGRIAGEVYSTNNFRKFRTLDVLENNGTLYNRKVTNITMLTTRHNIPTRYHLEYRCWIYEGNYKTFMYTERGGIRHNFIRPSSAYIFRNERVYNWERKKILSS